MYENKIVIENVSIEKNRINYHYTISGEWLDCFKEDEQFYIEYSIDVSSIPISIAVVPLLANLLPMAWICNAEIITPVCDRAFYESIPNLKKGYIDMYPMMEFAGNIIVKQLEENHSGTDGGTATFFSGGVDAFDTLVSHVNEHPTLITLWGADVKFEDEIGWNNVLNHLYSTSKNFGIDVVVVKSCFRRYLNENILNRKVAKDNWWHGFQHGIGLLSHAAPIAYIMKKDIIYIAASYTVSDKGKYTCASDPTIDNYLRFCDTHIVHDGYNHSRQDKINNIINFSKSNKTEVKIRVCWEAEGGKNCCNCEKCWRTILGIYSAGEDPQKYGFHFDDFSKICNVIKEKSYLMRHNRFYFYKEIQKVLHKNYSRESIDSSLLWFYDINIENLGKECLLKRAIRRLKRLLK